MPPSFFEDDTVDFPDDLDTSFFTRVSGDALYLRFGKKEEKKVNVNSFYSMKAECVRFSSI